MSKDHIFDKIQGIGNILECPLDRAKPYPIPEMFQGSLEIQEKVMRLSLPKIPCLHSAILCCTLSNPWRGDEKIAEFATAKYLLGELML